MNAQNACLMAGIFNFVITVGLVAYLTGNQGEFPVASNIGLVIGACVSFGFGSLLTALSVVVKPTS